MNAAAPTTPEASVPEQAPRRRVRNYLIDAGLQLRYASYLVAVAAVISAALGWMLWSAYAETSRVITLADPASSEGLAATLASVDRSRMLWLIGGLVLVVVCLLIFAVVVTHHVAGPAHFLARVCRQVSEGHLAHPRPLRRGDLLVELADEIAVMVDILRQREERDRSLLAAVAAQLRRAGLPDLAGAADTLDELVAEKERRLPS